MSDIKFLTEEEINAFLASLEKNEDSTISYAYLESRLDDAYRQLGPYGALNDGSEMIVDEEKAREETLSAIKRHEFLRQSIGTEANSITIEELRKIVTAWRLPSLQQSEQIDDENISSIPFLRRGRAAWKVHGPEYLFMAVVVSLQLGLGLLQGIRFTLDQKIQAAFGWGVAVAKFAAAALYPTLFFLLLSMSRWWSTAMRRWYYLSRFVNWDHSQAFHILMSIETLLLATLHAIGHLSGTFNWGSRPDRQAAVGLIVGVDATPRHYIDYLRSIYGWSGLVALGLLYGIALMSMPIVRRRVYEVFQAAHLLMFPFIGLLFAHGSARLLQYPVLGFALAAPTALIIAERLTRLIKAFYSRIPAKLEVLDGETVRLTCHMQSRHLWPYEPGQYVLLQVPQISFWQWHPFTISTCIGREMQLHIKTSGNWTSKLRDLEANLTFVGIDGPYRAPAHRFYDFEQAIVVGSGIGITPFAGILADLQTKENHRWSSKYKGRRGPARRKEGGKTQSEEVATTAHNSAVTSSSKRNASPHDSPQLGNNASMTQFRMYRRVDVHWLVRDKNNLLWFSDLLNRVCENTTRSNHDGQSNLDVRLFPYVTSREDDISMHICRCLLEQHRTIQRPQSILTGLTASSTFGRPNFGQILETHYQQMRELFARDPSRRRMVGVFFCGAPMIGKHLADLCHQMTIRAAQEGTGIQYHFQIEVFG